MMQRINF